MKILIAEDDATSRLLFAATLRKLGHTVTAIEDGRKAWEAWQKDEYPLLISDWMMPDIDGLQLCRMIRSEPGLQYTYIILLTALDSKGSYLEGMDAGADDFITKPFDEEQLAARLRVAERILGLHQTLHIQATRDYLTGVWNRASIMDYLQKELKRGARQDICTSVMIADLDHFKRINDTYGHAAGDDVLRKVAQVLRACGRQTDLFGRLGGEEFAVLLPESDLTAARELASRIIESCRGVSVETPGSVVSFTCSIGIAQAMPGDARLEDVVNRADAGLYEAKRHGRDQFATAGVVTSPSSASR